MKKLAIVIGGILLLAMILPAMAEPIVTINEKDCTIYDLNYNQYIATGSVWLGTSSGHAAWICTSRLPSDAVLPSKILKRNVVTEDGGQCGTSWGLTDKWWQSITPGGTVTLVCIY